MKNARAPKFPSQHFVRVLTLLCLFLMHHKALARTELLLVSGLSGQTAFGAEIEATAKVWTEAAMRGGHSVQQITPGAGPQLPRLQAALADVSAESTDPFWLVLLGHGSAQGKSPKFNLEGPDLSAEELARNLARLRRPVIVVAGFSCSGAFLKPLAAPGRIVLAATRTGAEENWTRFPRFFAAALAGLDADANGDMQVSVFEAWQHATQAAEASYKDQGRLTTEHAALDDLGDGKASGMGLGLKAAQWHLVESAAEAGLAPVQRTRREALELELGQLRQGKHKVPPAEYAALLERLLLKLARVYEGQAESE
jgi:hypothetical protein